MSEETIEIDVSSETQLLGVITVTDPVDHAFLEECMRVLEAKGGDYTEGLRDDRLRNFRAAAADTGITMEQVWWVYFFKHLASLKRHVREGQVESEPIRCRLVDLVNYLVLYNRMVIEREGFAR